MSSQSTPADEETVHEIEVILDGKPPSKVWESIAADDDFQAALVAGTQELVSDFERQHRASVLRNLGVTACGKLYADIVLGLLRECSDLSPQEFADKNPNCSRARCLNRTPRRTALRITTQFGRPGDSELGIHIPFEDIFSGPLPILSSSSSDSTFKFHLEPGFRNQRADQRRTICKLIRWLTIAGHVQIVASTRIRHWFIQNHRIDLPDNVRDQCNIPLTESTQGNQLSEAYAQLNPDGREVTILRQLAAESTQALTFSRLRSSHSVSRSRLSQCVSRLSDLGLIAKFKQPSEMVSELLPPGEQYLREIDREIGEQANIKDFQS